MAEKDNTPEMRPTFEEIRRTDENGHEYWSSRDLCSAMGYSANWKFQRVIDKAIEVANTKGMNIGDHFNQTVDMVKLGSGAFRKVEIFRLSRLACMIIAENADGKKVLVQQAREYFSQSVPTTELIQNSLESNILLYKTAQGETRIEVIFNNETFWMSQKRMAVLFGVDRATIAYHISQIYESGELAKEATCRKIQQVQLEGERDVERTPLFYNLDAIIAVGYRVNSYQATQFRIWATSVLKEFIIKGYVLDDERLKQGKISARTTLTTCWSASVRFAHPNAAIIRRQPTSMQKCSADYDAKSESTKLFFKMVQNMMHLAVTHHTAAEIVYNRADAEQPHMGNTKSSKTARIFPTSTASMVVMMPHCLLSTSIQRNHRPTEPRTYRNYYQKLMAKLDIPRLKYHGYATASQHGAEETLHHQDVQVAGQVATRKQGHETLVFTPLSSLSKSRPR